jgi:cell division protein FtsL
VRSLDWLVLAASLVFIVVYGVWKGRRNRNLDGYLLADRSMRWYTVAFSIMATQASAITFISTPGQAYVDGMRFVQFYFGLPLAMVVLSITPFRSTASSRFTPRTSTSSTASTSKCAASPPFSSSCSAGSQPVSPSTHRRGPFGAAGWNLHVTNWVIGVLVIIYTAAGGTKAVSHTNFWQMVIVLGGLFTTLAIALTRLPESVSFTEAVHVAGRMGKLNAIDFSFDLKNRYNFWSGIIGGFFLALSYFGTDQSQVGRYLSGQSVTQSRLGLLFNGMVKVPMQFVILFIGAMVFVVHQFNATPIHFNPVETKRVEASARAGEFRTLQTEYDALGEAKRVEIQAMLEARRLMTERRRRRPRRPSTASMLRPSAYACGPARSCVRSTRDRTATT